MKKYLPAPSRTNMHSNTASQAASLRTVSGRVLDDQRPHALVQRQLTALTRSSPRTRQQAVAMRQLKRPGQAQVIQGAFMDSAELREAAFLRAAEGYGVSPVDAKRLYKASGGNDPDPVTGLRTHTDKEASKELARTYADQGARGLHGDAVFYANIKFFNLAGLNAVKGHAGADDIFTAMAQHVTTALTPLQQEFKVQGYRHEGSRFGFMISGDKTRLTADVIERCLAQAKLTWTASKAERGIDRIPNPKRPDNPGVDLGYHLMEIQGGRARAQASAAVPEAPARASADVGSAAAVRHAFQGAAPGVFKGVAETRTHDFAELARQLRLSPEHTRALFALSGRAAPEALTGFDAAGDRMGTVEKARKLYQDQWPRYFAGYIEVDVRNLGGINDNLTRADSDNVFKYMADTTDKHVRSLKADVVSFRHGGDEFSFVVVARTGAVEFEAVRTILSDAQKRIDTYVQTKKIWQKRSDTVVVEAESGTEVSELNAHRLPAIFDKPFRDLAISRSKPELSTNTRGSLWRVTGSEAYWLISKQRDNFHLYKVPMQVSLSQILHSKDSPDKPRQAGTGIVWGYSSIFRDDTSPVDAVARADQEVESKKE